jgi:thioredoxin 1
MIAFDKDNFETEVVQSELPVVVDIGVPSASPAWPCCPTWRSWPRPTPASEVGKLNAAENRRFLMSSTGHRSSHLPLLQGREQKTRISGADVTLDSIKAHADSCSTRCACSRGGVAGKRSRRPAATCDLLRIRAPGPGARQPRLFL